MKVVQLRKELHARRLDRLGERPVLQARLEAALAVERKQVLGAGANLFFGSPCLTSDII